MCSTPVEVPAVARARWLADMADTLAKAEDVLERLKRSGEYTSTVVELQLRVRAARSAVESLRVSRGTLGESGPRRTNFAPWDS